MLHIVCRFITMSALQQVSPLYHKVNSLQLPHNTNWTARQHEMPGNSYIFVILDCNEVYTTTTHHQLTRLHLASHCTTCGSETTRLLICGVRQHENSARRYHMVYDVIIVNNSTFCYWKKTKCYSKRWDTGTKLNQLYVHQNKTPFRWQDSDVTPRCWDAGAWSVTAL